MIGADSTWMAAVGPGGRAKLSWESHFQRREVQMHLGQQLLQPDVRRIVDANAEESPKHKVVVQSVHQYPLRADRITPCSSIVRSGFSGAIDGRPIGEYRAANSGSSAANMSFTIARIARSR